LTSVLVLTPVLLFILTLAFIIRVALKLLSRRGTAPETSSDWVNGFSAAAYESMHALLCDEDFSFVSNQPGFDLDLYKRLRKERLRIFRQYMNRLITDYNRLHAGARALIAANMEDRSEMMGRLLKLKLAFMHAVVTAEVNYLLCCIGFRTLTIRAVVLRLEELNAQVAFISSAHAS